MARDFNLKVASQQFDTLLVNLCYAELEFSRSLEMYKKSLKDEVKSSVFLDTTGVLENNSAYSKDLLKLYSFDSGYLARRTAADKFVDYTSNLSDYTFSKTQHIRSLEVNKLPVYWLTDIAEKHPLYHILFNTFYFDELFNVVLKAVNFKQVVFLLPRDKFFYCESLKSYFSGKYKTINFKAISTGTYMRTVRETVSFVRKNYSEHVTFLKEFKKQNFKTSKIVSNNILLTYLGSTWKPTQKVDYVLDGLKLVVDSKAFYTPLIYNWKNIPEWKEEWDPRYIKAMPGKMDWFFLMLNYYRVVKKVGGIKEEHQLINNGPVSPYALKKELQFALEYKFYMLKNHLWLANYFKQLKSCNIFYQDEFYSFGRVISHAIDSNGTNRSVAFQHGMIREDHTVYALTEIEMNGKNPMPSPNYFVVWGKYFQDLVCKKAESIKKKVVIAANPNLIKKEDSEKSHLSENVTKAEYDLLWCSGIPQELSEEFTLIKSYLENHKDKKLLVRMHPLNDLSREITEGLNEIGFKNYTFSKELDLKNDFSKANLLVSGPASTVVLEAVSIGKNVVGINFGRYVPIEMGKSNYKEVSNAEQLNELIENYFPAAKNETNSAEVNSLFSRDFSKWKEVLI